jgi:hypothetical protein
MEKNLLEVNVEEKKEGRGSDCNKHIPNMYFIHNLNQQKSNI